MAKHNLPDFPSLFETIGNFLRDAEVPGHQQKNLTEAREALRTICEIVYYGEAKIYPCSVIRKIPIMTVSRAAK
jgi:hypothetical protein